MVFYPLCENDIAIVDTRRNERIHFFERGHFRYRESLETAILCEPARIIVRVIVVGIQKRDAHEAAD